MGPSIIRTYDLWKQYEDEGHDGMALRGVDIDIRKGQIVIAGRPGHQVAIGWRAVFLWRDGVAHRCRNLISSYSADMNFFDGNDDSKGNPAAAPAPIAGEWRISTGRPEGNAAPTKRGGADYDAEA